MEIKRSQQTLQAKKVEEDQSSKVKEAKPLGVQQTPDSFEIGRSRSDDAANTPSGSAQAASTDTIADQALNNQLIQARLGSIAAKDKPELKGRKGAGTDQENTPGVTTPNVEDPGINKPGTDSTGIRVPNGAFTGDARSRIDARSQQLRDYLAEQGGKLPGGGGGVSTGGGTPSGMASGNYPGGRAPNPEAAEAFAGGPTGPGNPFDNINQSGAETIAGFENLEQYAQTGPKAKIGKEMFEQDPSVGVGWAGIGGYDPEEGLKGGTANNAKDYPGLAEGVKQTYVEGGHNSPRAEMLNAAEKEINENSGQGTKKPTTETPPKEDKYTHQEGGGWTRLDANGETAGTKTAKGEYEYFAKDKNGNWEQVSEEEYKKRKAESDKKNGVSQPNPDEPEAHGPAISLQNLPRAPRIQGDIDPVEDANQPAGEYVPGLLQQFGKYGLVGQPGGPDSDISGGGGSISFGQRGSEIDYENGSGYMGQKREQNPGDVDVSGGPMGQLNVVDREQKEEEEKESRVTTKKKRA